MGTYLHYRDYYIEHKSDALAGQYRSVVQSQRQKGKDSELWTNVAM
jgi:hypothetical protein